MPNQNRAFVFFMILAVAGVLGVGFQSCSQMRFWEKQELTPPVEAPVEQAVIPPAETVAAHLPVETLPPPPEPTPVKKTKKAAKPAPVPQMAAPKIELHPELIPKDISIVRVYYTSMLNGPGSEMEFDINGSGFTKEFERMITVESGHPEVSVHNLALVTANQIHGRLKISEKCPTTVAFPKVLIQKKPVFQAPDPFGIIRPGEILNLIFTEMGESGRTGRFRVFTNLNNETFPTFKVTVSTPTIEIRDLEPHLPFVVDGSIIIGPAVEGSYDLKATLGEKVIWNKPGIIRVVKPNVGATGLIQRVIPADGFHRPGDRVSFLIQGSGFRPSDADSLGLSVSDLAISASTFTYIAPGRMEFSFVLPKDAPVKNYGLKLAHGTEVLQNVPNAFEVVPANWSRELVVSPPLAAGGSSQLKLIGRDFDSAFINGLTVEVDDPDLKVGSFSMKSATEAVAPISAGAGIKPGDYLIHIKRGNVSVNANFGNVIRVVPAQ